MTNPVTPVSTCVIVDTVDTMSKRWCVFEHHLYDGTTTTLIFVGHCLLVDAYKLIEGHRNTEWSRIVKPDAHLYVKIVYIGDRLACRNAVVNHVHSLPTVPQCNARGYNTIGLSRAIICSNGVRYETQTEAAQALNINQGSLSRHLNGDKSMKAVKGFTFKYVADQEP